MRKVLIANLLYVVIYTPSLFGQLELPISINGHGNVKINVQKWPLNVKSFSTSLELDPSAIYYLCPTDNCSNGFRIGLGVRLSFKLDYYKDNNFKNLKYLFSPTPLIRCYLVKDAFLELSIGPESIRKINLAYSSTSIKPEPSKKARIWYGGLGVGYSIKASNKIFIEPILIYQVKRAGSLKNSTDNDLYGEEEYGFKFLLGIQYRLFN